MAAEQTSFSLYQLNQHLQRVLAFNMRQSIWINCEVSEVGNSKGTVYLSLVERAGFELKAKAEAMIWRKDLKKITAKVGDSLWSILQVGRQVLLQVQVEFHAYHGMKLIVKDIDASVTIGQLELQRIQVSKKLKEEQFTELNQQLPAPTVWQRLAIISSSNAAGWQDFKNQLQHNPYQYRFECELFEAAMQGVNLCSEVMHQLQRIEERKNEFDAIVIVRGGGARLDLMGFDDYDLCVAIATAELPVLTGIGHDVDESLADLVAYHPLKTPTAVADFLIHQTLVFESEVQQLQQHIQQKLAQKWQQEYTKIENIEQQLQQYLVQKIRQEEVKIAAISEKLQLLNPQQILQRGFAAVLDTNGNMLSNVAQLQEGETYTLQLADGTVQFSLK